MAVGGQRHAKAVLLSGKCLITKCTGGWVGVEKRKCLSPTGLQTPNRPDCGKSEYVRYGLYCSANVACRRD